MKKMNLFTRFLCSCAGCDISTLSQCNSAEQRKMAIIGSCVLITPMLGIVSGAFAMQILSKNLPLSIAFGLLWGYIILHNERAVVSNTRPGTFNLGVFARLLLAGVFATAIAVPMELRVFEDAIQEKLANNLDISVKRYHPFRRKDTTHFGKRLPPVSVKGYHPFRKKVTTYFGKRLPL